MKEKHQKLLLNLYHVLQQITDKNLGKSKALVQSLLSSGRETLAEMCTTDLPWRSYKDIRSLILANYGDYAGEHATELRYEKNKQVVKGYEHLSAECEGREERHV